MCPENQLLLGRNRVNEASIGLSISNWSRALGHKPMYLGRGEVIASSLNLVSICNSLENLKLD